jgi:hypothetical protein
MATTPAAGKTKRAGNTQRLDETPSSPVLVEAVIVKKKEELAKAIGRPSGYTQDIANEFCSRIADGLSMRRICMDEDMPSKKTIFNWFETHEEFLHQYTRAKEASADAHADDIQDIADDVLKGRLDPQAARVAGDLKKWTASKLKPKKYGDKLDLTSDGKQMPAPIISIAAVPQQEKLDA